MKTSKKKEETEYTRLLKDARWQKKRLEILERDKWTCKLCGKGINDEITLNVHHILYRKDCMPWEYRNRDLITLCEDCHHNLHKKKKDNEKKQEKEREYRRSMGIIPFFRKLLYIDYLTPSEKIVLSYLIKLKHYDKLYGSGATKSAIAKELSMTRITVISAFQKMNSLGICDENGLVSDSYEKEFCKNGYFKIAKGRNISGDLLIFYSYLVAKSREYGYCIDTYKYKLAEETGKTETAITKLLNRLYRLGLAERLENGKLQINQ